MTERSPRGPRLALTFAVCLASASCHRLFVVPLDARAACDGATCATPVEIDVDTYVVDLDTPPAALLRQIVRREPNDGGASCGGGEPVVEVALDGARVEHGPARVGGHHRLRLRFPQRGTKHPRVPGDYEKLELELFDGGRVTCLGMPVARRPAP
jgi:hypothetical protein